jgi:hypothetical protein
MCDSRDNHDVLLDDRKRLDEVDASDTWFKYSLYRKLNHWQQTIYKKIDNTNKKLPFFSRV